jgi:uncharacterized protein with FMN-binding domain
MKRYFISFGLIALSAAYALYDRISSDSAAPVIGSSEPAQSGDTSTVAAPTYSQAPVPSSTSSSATATAGAPAPAKTGNAPKPVSHGLYTDGSYTGTSANAYYGYVQVKAVVSGGKLTAVQILDYPNDRSTSRYINSQALPYLEQEAISAQSANINTVSGASDTSQAFRESLASALASAKT